MTRVAAFLTFGSVKLLHQPKLSKMTVINLQRGKLALATQQHAHKHVSAKYEITEEQTHEMCSP